MSGNDTLYVTLGALAANYLSVRNGGDATWLLLIAPPSSGKTEHISALTCLPDVHMAAEISVAALLSGTPRREKARDANGGLLNQIGGFGILLLKDFTTILSMKHEKRAELLAALREIYDGSWTRCVGTDGGKILHWKGLLGIIAGCTEAIDTHHAVMSSMGERFIFFRLPTADDKIQKQRVRQALSNIGHESKMREELTDAVTTLFAGIEWPKSTPLLSEPEQAQLTDLACLTARCRSAVERDNYTRHIINIPDPETPTRVAQQLYRLLLGMLIIGVPKPTAWQVLLKVGKDSMPKSRLKVFEFLAETDKPHTTVAIAALLKFPTMTAERALEDLNAHGIVERDKPRENLNQWQLSDWARSCYQRIKADLPENSPISLITENRCGGDKTGKWKNKRKDAPHLECVAGGSK
ncbi:MAG: hypothetical protein JO316_15605 [Abitibacteriaceae bacterium]|nr:hypothetical protein [Abditibacteriaceae bacterium]